MQEKEAIDIIEKLSPNNIGEARLLFAEARRVISSANIVPEKYDLIAIDYAGIGDAIYHARLILQHMRRDKPRIAWITNPIVSPLFRDDKLMDVFPGFSCKFRHAILDKWINSALFPALDEIFKSYFPKSYTISISGNICKYWSTFGGQGNSFSDRFFRSCGINRDESIRHELKHNGEYDLKEKYILLEYSSLAQGKIPIPECELLVKKLKNVGINTVYVGAKTDPEILGGIDARGKNMYDVFSIAKKSIGLVGKASGNLSVCCFLPNIPVFEINIIDCYGIAACGLHPKVYGLSEDWQENIVKILTTQ